MHKNAVLYINSISLMLFSAFNIGIHIYLYKRACTSYLYDIFRSILALARFVSLALSLSVTSTWHRKLVRTAINHILQSCSRKPTSDYKFEQNCLKLMCRFEKHRESKKHLSSSFYVPDFPPFFFFASR